MQVNSFITAKEAYLLHILTEDEGFDTIDK